MGKRLELQARRQDLVSEEHEPEQVMLTVLHEAKHLSQFATGKLSLLKSRISRELYDSAEREAVAYER